MPLDSKAGAYTLSSLTKRDKGLYTIIGKTNKDASGHQIDITMRNRINRWRRWDAKSQINSNMKRKLLTAFMHLQKAKDKVGLPDLVIEKTVYI